MAGTGLPFPKTGDVLTQAPNVIDADRYSSARAWGQIAAAAGDVAKAGGDYLEYQQRQREVGYLAEREETIRRRALDLGAEHRDDSKAFDAAWKGFSEGVIAEAEPKAIPHLKRALGTHGNTAYGGILQREMVRAERLDTEQVQVNIDSTGRDVMASATAGTLYGPDGTFTPGGQIKIAEFRNKLNAAVNVKLMSPEKADFIYNDFLSKAQDEDTARRALDLYKTEGFEAAESYLRKNILENEGLSLKPEERRRAYSHGLQQIQKQRLFDRQDRGEVEAGARDLRARIDSGQAYEDAEVRDTAEGLGRVGSMRQRRDLILSDAVRKETRGANLPELATAARGARSVAEVINSAATESGIDRDLLMRIARIESGFNPNAVTGSYKGLFQLSDAEFARYGGRNIMDPAENARVAALKLRDEIAAFRTSYGRDPTATEIYLTHQQGVGGLKAHLTNPAAPAWQNMASTGEGRQKGEAWAKAAIWGNVPDNLKAQFGSVENITSAQFIELWRGKVEGGAAGQDAAALAPFQGEFAKRVQQVLIRDARTAWPAMKERIERGRPLDGPDFEAVREAAALSGDRKWHEEVEAEAFASKFGRRIESVPPNERPALLDQLRSEMPASGLPTGMQDQIDRSVTKQHERLNKQIREDQVSFAIERGARPPDPIDTANSARFRAGLMQRTSIVRGVSMDQGVPASSALRADEIKIVNDALNSPDPQVQARVLADITAGIEDHGIRMATLASLGREANPDTMVKLYAGGLYREAPAIGASILRGQHAIKADKRYTEKVDAEALDKHLPATVFPVDDAAEPLGAAATLRAAALARYADLALQAGDTKGDLNDARLKQAVADVTGGVLDHNGGKLVAPERNMTQERFDSIMWNMTEADLADVGTIEGQPITPRMLYGTAKLESVGDGLYHVQLNSDPLRPLYAYRFDVSGEPTKFVLDLRDRPEGPPAPSAFFGTGKMEFIGRSLRDLWQRHGPDLSDALDRGLTTLGQVTERLTIEELSRLGSDISASLISEAEAAPRIRGGRGARGLGGAGHVAWDAAREATFQQMIRTSAKTQEIIEKTGMAEHVVRERLDKRALAEVSIYDDKNNPLVALYIRTVVDKTLAKRDPELADQLRTVGKFSVGIKATDLVAFAEKLPNEAFNKIIGQLPDATYQKYTAAIAKRTFIDNGIEGEQLLRYMHPGLFKKAAE